MSDNQLSLDHILLKDPQYFKIQNCINKLSESRMLDNMAGNCISASETMQQLLFQMGIDSVIVECQLMITRDGTEQVNDVLFIGYDDRSFKGEVDTHVVVLTKGKVPLLIDLSLGHVLPADHSFVVERLNNKNEELGIYNIGNLTLSYTNKKNIKLHSIHQKNLLSKFLDEQEKITKIKYIEKLAYWALVISAIDVCVNLVILAIKIYSGN